MSVLVSFVFDLPWTNTINIIPKGLPKEKPKAKPKAKPKEKPKAKTKYKLLREAYARNKR